MNFRSFLCLLRRWHLHQDFRNPSQRLNMTLPQLSARSALGRTRAVLSFCCTCALLRRFSAPSALTLRMFTGTVDNFVDELQLDHSHGFFGRLGLLKSACVTQLAHHLVNVLPLRALGVFGQLLDLCLDLVSFSTPSLCCSRVFFTSKVYKSCRIR